MRQATKRKPKREDRNTPGLMVIGVLCKAKAYVLGPWLEAVATVRWPTGVRLHLVFDACAPEDFPELRDREMGHTANAQVNIDASLEFSVARIGTLREQARAWVCSLPAEVAPTHVLWCDVDCLPTPDAAERLNENLTTYAASSAAVPTRRGSKLLAKITRNALHYDPAQLAPDDRVPCELTGMACLLTTVDAMRSGQWRPEDARAIAENGFGDDGHFLLQIAPGGVCLDCRVRPTHYNEQLVGYRVRPAAEGECLQIETLAPRTECQRRPYPAIVWRGGAFRVTVNGYGDFERNREVCRGVDLPASSWDALAGSIDAARASHAKHVKALRRHHDRKQSGPPPAAQYDTTLIGFEVFRDGTEIEVPVAATIPRA